MRVTRLARGLPMGGDLEYVDGVTLAHALVARQESPDAAGVLMRSRAWLFAGGLAAGALTGWLLAQRRLATHQRDLFSPRPLRRLAALGFLAGQTGVDTIRLLRDYLAWERQPVLRRRAQAILRGWKPPWHEAGE